MYKRLIARFAEKPTGEYEHVSFPENIKVYVSINKAVCLAYLRWKLRRFSQDKIDFIELAIEWRKVGNRLGQPRSLLEVLARYGFKYRRKYLNSKRHRERLKVYFNLEKFLSNEKFKQHRLTAEDAIALNKDPDRHPRARTWIVTTPEGEEIVVHNLQRWCWERGLRPSHLYECALHSRRQHKGYKCRYANDIRNKK